MARARNIKPALFKNELLGEADPLLTILFQGLWCLADRDGRLEDRPKRIKAEIFPYRELPDFNGYLTELERLGFICRYEAESTAVIEVTNFTKHQSPHKTEKASDLPAKPESVRAADKAPLNNGSLTVKESLIPDSLLLIPDSTNKPLSNELLDDELKIKREQKQARTDLINQAFEFFWSCWPTKKNKKPAYRAFVKLVQNKKTESLEDFVNNLSHDIEQRLLANDFGFDRMHAATYLNGARWEDAIAGESDARR